MVVGEIEGIHPDFGSKINGQERVEDRATDPSPKENGIWMMPVRAQPPSSKKKGEEKDTESPAPVCMIPVAPQSSPPHQKS